MDATVPFSAWAYGDYPVDGDEVLKADGPGVMPQNVTSEAERKAWKKGMDKQAKEFEKEEDKKH